MPFPLFPFIFRRRRSIKKTVNPPTASIVPANQPAPDNTTALSRSVKRHFYNLKGAQTYASFFPLWNGWATAGHVIDEAGNNIPPFTKGMAQTWPGGLDAALIGCSLPETPPRAPIIGEELTAIGFPAGSAHPSFREISVYMQRPGALPGTWIGRIHMPDEPVVSGMSGGLVFSSGSNEPLGIIITRNSPADLNNDRDPDESLDFIALSEVWQAVKNLPGYV